MEDSTVTCACERPRVHENRGFSCTLGETLYGNLHVGPGLMQQASSASSSSSFFSKKFSFHSVVTATAAVNTVLLYLLGRDRLVGSRSRSIGSTGSAMIDWSNTDPDPSDLDPSNPAPGAGLTGSIGSKCDLCAYMVVVKIIFVRLGRSVRLVDFFVPVSAIVDFSYDAGDQYDLCLFWVTCQRHFLLRQHGNSQGPQKSVWLILKDPTDLRFGSGSGSDQTIIA